MSISICPECGKHNPVDAEACEECGAQLPERDDVEENTEDGDWYLTHWTLLLFPAFICAAGTQWTTILPPALFGWLIAFALVQFSTGFFQRDRDRWLFTHIAPFLILGLAAGFAQSNQYLTLFDDADINNPYLTDGKNFVRAIVAGLGGPVAVVVSLGAHRLYLRLKEDLYDVP